MMNTFHFGDLLLGSMNKLLYILINWKRHKIVKVKLENLLNMILNLIK